MAGFLLGDKMINTNDEIIEACSIYGAKRVYDAAYAFMRKDLSALPSVGLKNPNGVGEADYIGSKVFKLMSTIDKAKDLADIAVDTARLR
jgi:hypothetical protein